MPHRLGEDTTLHGRATVETMYTRSAGKQALSSHAGIGSRTQSFMGAFFMMLVTSSAVVG